MVTENEIGEFVSQSIDQVKKGLPDGCGLSGVFDFDISVATTSSRDGKVDIHLVSFGKNTDTKQVHRIRFQVIDKDSREENLQYVKNFLKDLLSELPKFRDDDFQD